MYIEFFMCTKCKECDAELSAMCVRNGCPKQHEGYTEVRFVKPEAPIVALVEGDPTRGITLPGRIFEKR